MQPACAILVTDGGAATAAAPRRASAELTAEVTLIREVPERLWAEWTALVADAAEPNAFAEPWFVHASLRHLACDPVRLIEVRDGPSLAGVVLVGIERTYGRIPIPHVENWRHHHLFLGTPLVRRGLEAAFWRAVLDTLDRAPWAAGFLHVRDLVEGGALHRGLEAAAEASGRSCRVVFSEVRALLQSEQTPQAYYEQTVRKKKRKELARLQNRLAEIGEVQLRELAAGDDLQSWIDTFLDLERSGWKGREGSALACREDTASFFRDAVTAAHNAGRLQFLRLEVGGRPVALLVNFLTPPGSFSFKTAFDEEFARFSPGVLIQLENLRILDRADIAWMDSCAAEQHPMIDSLWAERRTLVRVTLPLRGLRRRLVFAAARGLEEASAARRRRNARSDAAQESEL